MKTVIKQYALMTAGGFLIILGIIGLALPIVPQVPFFIMGIMLLMKGSEKVRNFMENNSLYRKFHDRYMSRRKKLSYGITAE